MWFLSKQKYLWQIGFTLSSKKCCLGFSKMSYLEYCPHDKLRWLWAKGKKFIYTYLSDSEKDLSVHTLPGAFAKFPGSNILPSTSILWTLLPRRRTQGPSKKIVPLPSYHAFAILRTVKTIMSHGFKSFIPSTSHSTFISLRTSSICPYPILFSAVHWSP